MSEVTSAFIIYSGDKSTGPSFSALGAMEMSATCERSAFLKTTFASIASIASVTTLHPEQSFAADALDDLSMPSASEQKTNDVSR